MSYFEFTFSGVLTDDVEKKSNDLLNEINKNNVPCIIHKIIDEEVNEDKKNRTIIIHSHYNITDYLLSHFAICKLEPHVIYKQHIM